MHRDDRGGQRGAGPAFGDRACSAQTCSAQTCAAPLGVPVSGARACGAQVSGGQEFSAQEFEILWAAYGRDRLPYPLCHRTAVADFDTLRRERDAAVERLLTTYTDDLERALDVLMAPDARVEAKGFGGPDMSRVYRFHGAVRGQVGATVTQDPGIGTDTGGRVFVSYCTATHVAHRAVAELPTTGPGTRRPVQICREALAADRRRYVRRADELSLTEQLDRFFRRPRRALGEIAVFPGAAVDARPAPSRGFWWMDYDDGRYYVRTGDPIVATPIGPARLAAEIHRLTALTQRYYRQDCEHEDYRRAQR